MMVDCMITKRHFVRMILRSCGRRKLSTTTSSSSAIGPPMPRFRPVPPWSSALHPSLLVVVSWLSIFISITTSMVRDTIAHRTDQSWCRQAAHQWRQIGDQYRWSRRYKKLFIFFALRWISQSSHIFLFLEYFLFILCIPLMLSHGCNCFTSTIDQFSHSVAKPPRDLSQRGGREDGEHPRFSG